jgi:hypothetical protein
MAELDNNLVSSDFQIISVIFPRLGIIVGFGKISAIRWSIPVDLALPRQEESDDPGMGPVQLRQPQVCLTGRWLMLFYKG